MSHMLSETILVPTLKDIYPVPAVILIKNYKFTLIDIHQEPRVLKEDKIL
jgi:hypothetical protein